MSKRQMLINYVPGEECRIAITENRQLEELYQERASSESHVGNIYKGRVVNVEPAIGAAFIEFGLERNGFLHVSDLHPKYFPGESKEDSERVGQKTPRRERPPIQRCLRRGQEILVQVLKEGIGTKGPTLTSYLSIPGRFLVMMPDMERMGVSRKIEDDDARREMRQMLDTLDPPDNFGFIIRTAGIGRTKTELRGDLTYLQRMWKAIDRRLETAGIGELYTESDLVIRTIRDVFTNDIERIIVDHPDAARRASDFLHIISPRSSSNVLIYRDPVPLFHRYDIERQIEGINNHTVELPSGGSLVIESTEALVAIDVNSGRMRDNRDAETTAYKTNLEAATEICRQLRLRDLGGVIVNDLIDMRQLKYRREIEQLFRQNLKKDRARTRILAISQFGILEMTRQRMRPALSSSIYTDCAHCKTSGRVKSTESVVLDVMRRLALALFREQVTRAELTVSPDVAFHLLNRHRKRLAELENSYEKPVMVRVHESGPIDLIHLAAFDARGNQVEAESLKNLAEPALETVDPRTATKRRTPRDAQIEDITAEEATEAPLESDELETPSDQDEPSAPKKKRRRRRRRRSSTTTSSANDGAQADVDPAAETDAAQISSDDEAQTQPVDGQAEQSDAGEDAAPPRKRRRRRRRRSSAGNGEPAAEANATEAPANPDAPQPQVETEQTAQASSAEPPPATAESDADAKPPAAKRPRRRRGRSKRPAAAEQDTSDAQTDDPTSSPPPPA